MKMRKLLPIVFALCVLASCDNKKSSETTSTTTETAVLAENLPTYTLDSLLTVADQLIDKKVIVKGSVTHTCKHSGKRCFIVGDNENVTMRVEAKGEIGGFNRELIGSELAIQGTIKERRLTKEYIDQMEKETNEKKLQEDGSAETCQAELNNINEMRNWMKNNNKEYYSIFYMDGEQYDVVK